MQSTKQIKQQRQNKEVQFDFDQPALIIGMGKTGLSCARFLHKNNVPFAMADSRELPPLMDSIRNEFAAVKLITGDFQIESFLPYQQFLISPGISIRESIFLQLQQQGKTILGDIELFAQVVDKPVIAITGSNGKSTVTTLVEAMAKACDIKVAAGGNLGQPALDLLTTQSELYILELSSFQLETTYSLKPLSACVLNISEDHMDRYADMNDYRQVKETIYKQCLNKVINKQEFEFIAKFHADEVILFGAEPAKDNEYGMTLQDGKICLTKGSRILLTEDQIRLKGEFNYLNILAAIALLEPLQLSEKKLLTAAKDFKGLAHRCEWIAMINGIAFYNDSKGTNPGATIAALESFSQPEILIAGGVGKDADFSELGRCISRKVKAAVLLGADAGLIKSAAEKAGIEAEVLHQVKTMQEAVITAFNLAAADDVIVFSPACASFDMYANYIQRGEDFTRQVLALNQLCTNKEPANPAQMAREQDGYQNAC